MQFLQKTIYSSANFNFNILVQKLRMRVYVRIFLSKSHRNSELDPDRYLDHLFLRVCWYLYDTLILKVPDLCLYNFLIHRKKRKSVKKGVLKNGWTDLNKILTRYGDCSSLYSKENIAHNNYQERWKKIVFFPLW